jgi:hypothetical protein
MAEVKISALASATSLVGTEAVPVVQGGVTRRVRTSEIAGLLQPAIDVVSQALSVEQAARNTDISRLSNQISDIISSGGGAISVNSAELNATSVALEFHANVISLNLENEISARAAASLAASALNTAGTSVRGAQNIANALSSRISAIVAGANSVTSAELSVVYAALSNRISITSAVASVAELHASTASDAATSANLHANAASAAATSILNYICAVSVISGGTSTKGLQSVVDALSNRISAAVAGVNSTTSNDVSVIYAALSNRISVTSAVASAAEVHASTASAAATSADTHANAASAAATSVNSRATSIMALINAVSAKSAATSTRGLQSIVDQLSNHLSVLSANPPAISVTSTELSAALVVSATSAATSVKGLQSVVNQISNRISALAAGGTANSVTSNEFSALSTIVQTETDNRTSADNVLSFRISVLSNALSIETARAISVETAFSNLLSAAAINTASALSVANSNFVLLAGLLSNLSVGHTSLVNRVSALSAVGGPVSVTSAELSTIISLATSVLNKASVRNTAGTSVQGHQSVLNALSVRIAAGGGSGSVTSNEASAISAQALSVHNVLSNVVSALSTAHTNLSNALSARILSIAANSNAISVVSVHADVASAAATSADTHANTASAAATSVDARATSLETRLSALSALHQALSDVVSNALSAGDALSVTFNAISNKMSVFSANIGTPQLRRLTTTATISASGLTKISGLSATLVSTGSYQVHAVLMHSHSLQATNGFGFGVSGPVVTMATGVWRGFTSVVQPASAIFGYFNQAGMGSITYSVAGVAASATNYRTELDMDLVNVTSGTLQLKARSSAATTGAIDVQAGSYIQAFRIN